jgi:hypothetical protein
MPTTMRSPTNEESGAVCLLKRGLLATYCVSLVTVCSLLVVNGPKLRAAADAREAHIAEEENRAFCSKFGVGPGTSQYAQCASELTQIRASYLQRYLSESIL